MSAVLAQAYFLFLDGDLDDAVMALGSVTGARADAAWGAAPWFSKARFLGAVSAESGRGVAADVGLRPRPGHRREA
ncbi:hypothetical protein ABZS88_24350 [Streptomyces sp. NPDC005480]|uniref:hypothetical protein n=1 Tax=Streptomyces sp. NPDC005480 TaxID=3154880 RepID=UPI0033B9A239